MIFSTYRRQINYLRVFFLICFFGGVTTSLHILHAIIIHSNSCAIYAICIHIFFIKLHCFLSWNKSGYFGTDMLSDKGFWGFLLALMVLSFQSILVNGMTHYIHGELLTKLTYQYFLDVWFTHVASVSL